MRRFGGDLSYDEANYCVAKVITADCRQPIISDIGFCRSHYDEVVDVPRPDGTVAP